MKKTVIRLTEEQFRIHIENVVSEALNEIEGKTNFVSNAVSAMATSIIGVFLSIVGLLIFSYANGGEIYLKSLSESFLFGGNPSIPIYSISLLFEGIASSVIVTLLLMLYLNDRYKAD